MRQQRAYNLVVDVNVGVYLYDSNWIYKSTFNLTNIYYGTVGNNFYYFSLINSYGIIKTSMTSPTVIKSYGSAGKYRGLYYDTAGSKIIAEGCDISSVDILDLDLNFQTSVSFRRQCPHGVIVYNTVIYVALNLNGIAIISSNLTINTFPTICSEGSLSISYDSFEYFALSCWGDNIVYIYDSNMQYKNKSIGFFSPFDARFDTN